MHLEPVEIQHVKLRRRVFGYDREAVDRLLEDVTASYEDVWFERSNLDAELASLRNRLDGQAQAKEALEGSVRVAQETADELLAQARARAQAIVSDAHTQALATVREARAEQQRLHMEVRKLEVSETEITLRMRALLTAARELLDRHENVRDLTADVPPGVGAEAAANGAGNHVASAAEPSLAGGFDSGGEAPPPTASVGPARVASVELPRQPQEDSVPAAATTPAVVAAPVEAESLVSTPTQAAVESADPAPSPPVPAAAPASPDAGQPTPKEPATEPVSASEDASALPPPLVSPAEPDAVAVSARVEQADSLLPAAPVRKHRLEPDPAVATRAAI